MKEFRTKELRVKLSFTCVSVEYFRKNLSDYYEFLSCDICESKVHGFYCKNFYKLRSFSDIKALGLDEDFYFDNFPAYICASIIY